MSRKLQSKVRVVSQDRLRKMEAVARVAMLELSTSFRRHVNLTLRDMFVLMSAPRHADAEWRGKLHELARDLQSVGGSFDYGLLSTIGEVMCQTINDESLASDGFCSAGSPPMPRRSTPSSASTSRATAATTGRSCCRC